MNGDKTHASVLLYRNRMKKKTCVTLHSLNEIALEATVHKKCPLRRVWAVNLKTPSKNWIHYPFLNKIGCQISIYFKIWRLKFWWRSSNTACSVFICRQVRLLPKSMTSIPNSKQFYSYPSSKIPELHWSKSSAPKPYVFQVYKFLGKHFLPMSLVQKPPLPQTGTNKIEPSYLYSFIFIYKMAKSFLTGSTLKLSYSRHLWARRFMRHFMIQNSCTENLSVATRLTLFVDHSLNKNMYKLKWLRTPANNNKSQYDMNDVSSWLWTWYILIGRWKYKVVLDTKTFCTTGEKEQNVLMTSVLNQLFIPEEKRHTPLALRLALMEEQQAYGETTETHVRMPLSNAILLLVVETVPS